MADEIIEGVAKQVDSWFEESGEAERELRQAMAKDFRFYLGDQWEGADKTKLNEEGRPILTINKIRPVVKIIMGYQRQNQTDIRALPVEASDFAVTDVLNQTFKVILEPNGAMATSLIFLDGLICGKGWGYLYLDNERNPYDLTGDLVFKHISPFHVFCDPWSVEPDLSDARYVIRYIKMTLPQLKRLYPKAADALNITNTVSAMTDEAPGRYKGYQSDPYGHAAAENTAEANLRDDRLAVKECWYREYKREKFIYNTESGEFYPANLTDEVLDALTARVPTLKVLKRIIPRVRVATVAGGVELEDHESPIEGNIYPLLPYYCDFVPSAQKNEWRYQGIVRSLIDPQQEKNKRRAQMLHIVNTSANSGWIMESGAVQNKGILEKFGSKPGIVIEVNPGRKLDKIEPSNVPRAYTDLELMSDADIKQISNINPDMLGQYEKTASGIAVQMRQKQGITSIQEIFDNFSFMKKNLGKLLLHAIQSLYTPQKLMRIVGPNHQIEQKYQLPMEVIVGLLSTKDLAHYDVSIDEAAASANYRMARFQQLLQLAQVMPGLIPPEILIEASDISGKEELLNRLSQNQGQPAPPADGGQNPALNQAIQQTGEIVGAGTL